MIDLTYSEALLNRIRANLKRFVRQTHAGNGLKKAAVALTVVDVGRHADRSDIAGYAPTPGHAAMILTKRSNRLRNHAGQWALPGGHMEAGERVEDTVLRELEEEVGLKLDACRVIGRLDDYSTRSGFTIKPVVVWGGSDVILSANPAEVASIHLIPLAEFMRGDAPILQKIPESDNPVLMMPVGDTCIAAPTAALLYQFREVAMLGKERRVDHYEQPYFAWQ
jgi:8-oxo-dGTP pyrophosphatase MutT (NUDIX family)